jgi:signal transduction histidine kinase
MNLPDMPDLPDIFSGLFIGMAVLFGVVLLIGLVVGLLTLARRRKQDRKIKELISNVSDTNTRERMQIEEAQKQRTADARMYNAFN